MAALSKIFITVIFVLSSVFLGFAIAIVAHANDNPKYQYMRELRLRKHIKFDNARLKSSVLEEQGSDSEGKAGRLVKAVSAMDKTYKSTQDQITKSDADTQDKIREHNDTLKTLNDIEKEVSNFVASMQAFKVAIESFERKNANLLFSYQDSVRQYESLAVEYVRLQLEYQKLSEEHRAISDAFTEAQDEGQKLSAVVAEMLTQNPDLEVLSRKNGKLVEGNVLKAAEPPAGVVLLSIGTNEGVVRGQRFSVLRGGEFIAKVKIIRVETNSSIALVESPYQNVKINTDDKVRRSLILLRSTGSEINR